MNFPRIGLILNQVMFGIIVGWEIESVILDLMRNVDQINEVTMKEIVSVILLMMVSITALATTNVLASLETNIVILVLKLKN